MTTEFTPGPWGATHGTGPKMQSYSQPSGVHGTGEHRMKIICGCFGDIGGPDVAAANARLIAAAPDLLAALVEARRYVVGAYECAFPDDQENTLVLEGIDAAITKATVP